MLLLHIITFIPTGIQSANDKHWCYGAYGTPQVRGEGSASLVLRRLFGEEAWSLEVGLSEIGTFQFWMFNIIIFPIKNIKMHTHMARHTIIPYFQTHPNLFACNDAEWNAWVPSGLIWFRDESDGCQVDSSGNEGLIRLGSSFCPHATNIFFPCISKGNHVQLGKKWSDDTRVYAKDCSAVFFLNRKPFWFLVCQHAISLRKKNIHITYYVNYIIHA